jgi:hypothetical protein
MKTSKNCGACSQLAVGIAFMLSASSVVAAPESILFVGNSYTFGRVDPVMSYNAAGVRDLTAPMLIANASGSNAFEPRPWGGVAGIFKQFTVQSGLDYDVAMSARNAASLRGHALNTNAAGWDLRSNITSQTWSKVVLQEQSDESLPKQLGLASNPDYFKNYVNKIENLIHSNAAQSYRERDFFAGATTADQTSACVAATGASATTCNTLRNLPGNAKASNATDVYLYQTWARPNLINAPFTTVTDPLTGAVSFTTTPATSFYSSLEAMTSDLKTAALAAADLADNDGTRGITKIAPVGEAFLLAVTSGVATRNMYSASASTDGLIDLWFDDGTHASKWGSYLSALTIFGSVTGKDPLGLGAAELAASDLGISSADAVALQTIASRQLGFGVPIPSSFALLLPALGLLLLSRRSAPSDSLRGHD